MHPQIKEVSDTQEQIKYSNYVSLKQTKANQWFIEKTDIEYLQNQAAKAVKTEDKSKWGLRIKAVSTWFLQPDETFFKTVPEYVIFLGTRPSRPVLCDFCRRIGRESLISRIPDY